MNHAAWQQGTSSREYFGAGCTTGYDNLLQSSHRSVVRHGLLACTMLFLVWFAWQALSGGFRQIAHSHTIGQKVQTITQLECGFLSLLIVFTSFYQRRWARLVHTTWSITLMVTAGLSSLVWGPPMPLIGILFVVMAILMSRATQWALRLIAGLHA